MIGLAARQENASVQADSEEVPVFVSTTPAVKPGDPPHGLIVYATRHDDGPGSGPPPPAVVVADATGDSDDTLPAASRARTW